MAKEISTIQSEIKHHTNDDLLNYSLFLGGLNATHDVLANYDPLKTGYARLFMIRKPLFVNANIESKLNKFKHILEYGNTAIEGIGNIEVEFESLTGGYAGKSFEIPTIARDNTNEFTVTCYEFSGSPIREVIHTWINGSVDVLTGVTHYNGDSSAKLQSNQTAEFIYVATDNTGENVEYACLLANCFPKTVKADHFNYRSGEHNIVQYEIPFTCTKYESNQIARVAKKLLSKYKLLNNSLNFYSGVTFNEDDFPGLGYDVKNGKMTKDAVGKDTKVPMTSTELEALG